jgi:hypothetical protein
VVADAAVAADVASAVADAAVAAADVVASVADAAVAAIVTAEHSRSIVSINTNEKGFPKGRLFLFHLKKYNLKPEGS